MSISSFFNKLMSKVNRKLDKNKPIYELIYRGSPKALGEPNVGDLVNLDGKLHIVTANGEFTLLGDPPVTIKDGKVYNVLHNGSLVQFKQSKNQEEPLDNQRFINKGDLKLDELLNHPMRDRGVSDLIIKHRIEVDQHHPEVAISMPRESKIKVKYKGVIYFLNQLHLHPDRHPSISRDTLKKRIVRLSDEYLICAKEIPEDILTRPVIKKK